MVTQLVFASGRPRCSVAQLGLRMDCGCWFHDQCSHILDEIAELNAIHTNSSLPSHNLPNESTAGDSILVKNVTTPLAYCCFHNHVFRVLSKELMDVMSRFLFVSNHSDSSCEVTPLKRSPRASDWRRHNMHQQARSAGTRESVRGCQAPPSK